MLKLEKKGSSAVKILHLTSSCFYGGPEKQMLEQALRHDPSRFKITLSSFANPQKTNDFLNRAESAGVATLVIPFHNALDYRAIPFIRQYLQQTKTSLLCIHGYKSVVMGWLSARTLSLPVIAFSRGYTTENPKVAVYEWLERKFLKKTDTIIAVSKGQADRLISMGLSGQNIEVVHNAVDTLRYEQNFTENQKDELLKILGVPNDSRIVVSAGRLSPEKGHRYLVEAIKELKIPDDVYFIFCGDGICRASLEQQARQLGIANRCRFVGFRKDIPALFRQMEFMVLPSLTEGLPNVVLEAFSCRKPVISSDVGGVPEIIRNRSNGLLVESMQPGELAKAMDFLLSAPRDLLMEYGENAYETVINNFNFEHQINELEKIYSEVLEQ